MKLAKKQFRLRINVYVTYILFALVLFVLFAICQYGKEFFKVYQTMQTILNIAQVICLLFIASLMIILITQYKKAGVYTFYSEGIRNMKTNELFYYSDIIEYHFVPQSNKQAKALQFETDDKRTGTLTALLPPQSFVMFQEDHAAIWTDFIIQKIDNKNLYTIELDDDLTSFKMTIHPSNEERQIVLSHEGIVVYSQFYKWPIIKRIDVSWSGMFSIKDVDNKTIFLEPITSIPNYCLFVQIVKHYIQINKGVIQ